MKLSETGQPDNDKVLAKIEKKINKEYTIANKEMEKKLKNYMKKFEAKDKEKKKLVKSGQLSQEDYIKWRQDKIVVGKQWESMCQVLAEDLDNSRIIAQHIVSNDLPTVYANGVNYGTYEIEKTGINTNFTLYNHDAVEILVSENPKLYPDPTQGSETWQKLKSKEVQKWSKAKINSSITQAILQGEAIDQIAKRLRKVTDMDYKASIRNARTMVGAAQNAGHQRSYERAENMGVQLSKVWVATLDMRTRHTHAVMDGEAVPVKEKFSNGLLYPRDMINGTPAEVYNCRCRPIAQVKGFEKGAGSLVIGKQDKLNGMTYDEWKQWHQDILDGKTAKKASEQLPKKAKVKVKKKAEPIQFEWAEEYKQIFGDRNDEFVKALYDNNAAKTYNKYSDRIEGGFLQKAGNGYYQPSSDTVFWDYRKSSPFAPALGDGYNKFGTFCHEFGHAVDYHIAEDVSLSYKEQGVLQNVGRRLTGWFDKKKGSNCDEFLSAFRKDKDVLSTVMKSENAGDVIQDIRKHTSTGLQDAFDGMFGTRSVSVSSDTFLPFGHGERYYNRNYNAFKDLDKYYPNVYRDKKPWKIAKDEFEGIGLDVKKQADVKAIFRDHETASELWANLHMAISVGGEQLEMFEKYMPNSLAEFRRIIGQLN